MGQRVSMALAATITGRSPTTIRAAIRAGDLPAEAVRWHGGRKGEPGRVWDIDTSALRVWHEAHGGKVWQAEAIPDVTLEVVAAKLDALLRRVDCLEQGRIEIL